MKLGIDFGTTRIIAAMADRGNYPIIDFEAPDGTRDWIPSLVAARGGELRFGWDAWRLQTDTDWTILRSVKRHLERSTPGASLAIGAVAPAQPQAVHGGRRDDPRWADQQPIA